MSLASEKIKKSLAYFGAGHHGHKRLILLDMQLYLFSPDPEIRARKGNETLSWKGGDAWPGKQVRRHIPIAKAT
jgi:hypothetical protein